MRLRYVNLQFYSILLFHSNSVLFMIDNVVNNGVHFIFLNYLQYCYFIV